MRKLALALLLVLVPSLASAETYYVRTDGNNGNTGLTNTSGGAWLTISQCASTIVAGDTCRVQAGTYTEQVSETTNGTLENPITYVADGTVVINGGGSGSNVVSITGNYVRVIGFTIQQTAGQWVGLWAPNTTGLEVWNCRFMDFLDGAVWNDRGTYAYTITNAILIGNYVRASENKDYQIRGTSNLLAYNESDLNPVDFIYLFGPKNRLLNNYEHDMDADPSTHTDFWQNGNGGIATADTLLESNVLLDSGGSDHHIFNLQDDSVGAIRAVIRGNIWHNIGSQTGIAYNNDYYKWYHESMIVMQAYWPTAEYAWYVWAGGTPDYMGVKNSIMYQAWGTSVTNVNVYDGSGTPTGWDSDYNIFYDTGGTVSFYAPAGTEAHSQRNVDPGLTNVAGDVFTIASTGSAAYGTGGPLTTVTSTSGTGASFTVGDATWFVGDDTTIAQYGGNLVVGDTITVGTDVVTISSISGNTITVTSSFTWAQNDPVYWGTDTTPDVGALPYRAGGYSLTATYAGSGTITVTPNDAALVRFVVCYDAGVPYAVDNSSPYTCIAPSGTFSARVYPRYASTTLWTVATAGGGTAPAAPTNVRIR